MKQLRNILMAGMVLIIMAGTSYAANTIVYGNHTVGISAIDTNYDFGADATIGSPAANAIIDAIIFKPAAAGNTVQILDGAAAAKPGLMEATSIDGGNLVVYIGKRCRPYIVAAGTTNNAAAKVTIIYRTSISER